MKQIENDVQYLQIVSHILANKEFDKIKMIEHHGVTRYDHSLKVSYVSYRIAKFLHLDYEDTARGGLLHDFFMSDIDRSALDRFISTFVHPKRAVENSIAQFGVSAKEADIIRSHMFPINIAFPKYGESWIVNFVDKTIGIWEFAQKFGYRFQYATNLSLLLLFQVIR